MSTFGAVDDNSFYFFLGGRLGKGREWFFLREEEKRKRKRKEVNK